MIVPKYTATFRKPEYVEVEVMDNGTRKVGTIRLKPVAVCWKPANASYFHTVSMDKFVEWITSEEAGARRRKS